MFKKTEKIKKLNLNTNELTKKVYLEVTRYENQIFTNMNVNKIKIFNEKKFIEEDFIIISRITMRSFDQFKKGLLDDRFSHVESMPEDIFILTNIIHTEILKVFVDALELSEEKMVSYTLSNPYVLAALKITAFKTYIELRTNEYLTFEKEHLESFFREIEQIIYSEENP